MSGFRIGLISDTHGLLRPEALAFLRGCDHIVHAGDIGDPQILEGLAALAPLTAVRGNNDRDEWAARVPVTDLVCASGLYVYAVHDLDEIDIDPAAAGVQVVVSGHTHRPHVDARGGVLYINPGSAGPRRGDLPVSVGELVAGVAGIAPRIVEFDRAALSDV